MALEAARKPVEGQCAGLGLWAPRGLAVVKQGACCVLPLDLTVGDWVVLIYAFIKDLMLTSGRIPHHPTRM